MKVISVKLPSKEDIVNAAAMTKTSYHDENFEEQKMKLDYGDAVKFLKKLFLGERPSDRHESPLEFLDFEFNITGITKEVAAELRTYRMASHMEKSFRKKRGKIEFYVPDSKYKDEYEKAYSALGNLYKSLLARGEDPEDARLILPQGVLTETNIKLNCRSLRNLLTQRLAKAANKRMQELAKLIILALMDDGEDDLTFLVEDIIDKHNKGLL